MEFLLAKTNEENDFLLVNVFAYPHPSHCAASSLSIEIIFALIEEILK